MTINCQIETITNSIAGWSISGVSMHDIHDIPESVELLTPTMFPRPNDFVTDMGFERVSQGGAGTAMMNLTYTLNYVYCHAPIGSGLGGLFSVYSGLITNIALIMEKIFASDNPTGGIDLQLAGLSSVGPVSDPSGKAYHGVEIALRVVEFIQ
jgi:hypothetical protein